jgi:two-component system KDP operon response regulator KdpE
MYSQFHILVVDDDREMLETLRLILDAEGFNVITARDGRSGLRAAYQHHPDVILLDIIMPEMDGFEVCHRLREMTDVPIIFLTAKGTIEDIVQGLSAGADDYITKPFNRSELISRLKVCLRRGSAQPDEQASAIFAGESVMLDFGKRKLLIGNRTVHLNPKEFQVLRLLIRHSGKALSTDAILAQVWGADLVGEPDLVKQYIYRLRRKIELDPSTPRFIHTLRGQGYYFEAS